MKILGYSLFILLLLGCSQAPKRDILAKPFKPIELAFRPLTKNDRMKSSLSAPLEMNGFLAMQVKNLGYDSLSFCLLNYEGNLVYRSDVRVSYQFVSDSLQQENYNIRCFSRCDSFVTILLGDSFDCIFEGVCTDSMYVFKYNFSFEADSAGVKLFPQFKQFPCEVNLPIKKNN